MARTLREIVEREKPEVVQRAKNLASEMLLDIHLAEIRALAELTQKEMALALGITQPTVSGMERAGHDILLTSLKKYVEAAGGRLRMDVEMPNGRHYGFLV
jgi:DNA-binding XRE family transcriptional regulator